MPRCFLLNYWKLFFISLHFLILNSNVYFLCICTEWEKTPKRLHTKEQSLLFPEIDVCLWGNPACNFQNLQVHCKLNHVASTQIIPSFQNQSSELPVALFPWIFPRWSAPAKPQFCVAEPLGVVVHQPSVSLLLSLRHHYNALPNTEPYLTVIYSFIS